MRHAESIPESEIWEAHARTKADLLTYVIDALQSPMKEEIFTIGFALRVTAYKRADLLFTDLERLKDIAREHGVLHIRTRDSGGSLNARPRKQESGTSALTPFGKPTAVG